MADAVTNCRVAPPPAGFEFRGVQRLESGDRVKVKAAATAYRSPSRAWEVEGLDSGRLGASTMRRRCGSQEREPLLKGRSGTRFDYLGSPVFRHGCLRLGALEAGFGGHWCRRPLSGQHGVDRLPRGPGGFVSGPGAAGGRAQVQPEAAAPRPRLRVNAEPVMVRTSLSKYSL